MTAIETATQDDRIPQETATALRWPAILMFLVIALGAPWLIEIPVWVTPAGGRTSTARGTGRDGGAR